MLKNDDNGKQLRCLLVEDYQTGAIKKVREREAFESTLKETDEMFITKVYEPTQAQREELLTLIQENVGIEQEESVVTLSEVKTLFLMLKFTDIELDSEELEDNHELLEAVISNPNPLFVAIRNELELIIIETVAMLYDAAKVYRTMPDDLLNASNELMVAKANLDKKKKDLKKKQKKVTNLQTEIKKVEDETIEMA